VRLFYTGSIRKLLGELNEKVFCLMALVMAVSFAAAYTAMTLPKVYFEYRRNNAKAKKT